MSDLTYDAQKAGLDKVFMCMTNQQKLDAAIWIFGMLHQDGLIEPADFNRIQRKLKVAWYDAGVKK